MSITPLLGTVLILSLLPGVSSARERAARTEPPAQEPHSHAHPGVPERFPDHPGVGEDAPDFSLRDLAGRWTALGEFLGRGYVVLFFGSISSSRFQKSAPEMSRLASDWERMEVKVVLVYTREAHPAALKKKAPRNYRERAALARKSRQDLKLGFPILVDEWDDAVHHAYGAMPDAAFLLDSKGQIVFRQAQAGAASLDKELEKLLDTPEPPGPADRP